MWKSQSEILETPRTSGSKNETPCEKTPSTAQDSSQAPKDGKTKGQYLKKKKKDIFKQGESIIQSPWPKEPLKAVQRKLCSFSVKRKLKPERISYNCTI